MSDTTQGNHCFQCEEYDLNIRRLEAEIDSLRRKNELLCQTAERSVLLSRIEEIIYSEWDDGMYLAAPSDVMMYLKKALQHARHDEAAQVD